MSFKGIVEVFHIAVLEFTLASSHVLHPEQVLQLATLALLSISIAGLRPTWTVVSDCLNFMSNRRPEKVRCEKPFKNCLSIVLFFYWTSFCVSEIAFYYVFDCFTMIWTLHLYQSHHYLVSICFTRYNNRLMLSTECFTKLLTR